MWNNQQKFTLIPTNYHPFRLESQICDHNEKLYPWVDEMRTDGDLSAEFSGISSDVGEQEIPKASWTLNWIIFCFSN